MQALLMLAVWMQLCAPLLHAQAMASETTRFVDTAFCGDKLRGQRLQLRNPLPAEVRVLMARSQSEAASTAAPACDDCVCASPAALAAIAADLVANASGRQPFVACHPLQAVLPGSPLLPPPTGPPAVAIARVTADGPTAVVFPDL